MIRRLRARRLRCTTLSCTAAAFCRLALTLAAAPLAARRGCRRCRQHFRPLVHAVAAFDHPVRTRLHHFEYVNARAPRAARCGCATRTAAPASTSSTPSHARQLRRRHPDLDGRGAGPPGAGRPSTMYALLAEAIFVEPDTVVGSFRIRRRRAFPTASRSRRPTSCTASPPCPARRRRRATRRRWRASSGRWRSMRAPCASSCARKPATSCSSPARCGVLAQVGRGQEVLRGDGRVPDQQRRT